MRRPVVKLCFVVAAVLATFASSLGPRAVAQGAPPAPPPSVTIGTAALIDPGTADTFYTSGRTVTAQTLAQIYMAAGLPAPVTPPEIVALAGALHNNPDEIYEYVHNHIAVVWMYGLAKGPLGTMIDKAGTPFDQAALMMALLNQAGFSATYQVGTVTMDGPHFQAWTGISDATTACQMLSSGGFPAIINAQTIANCAYGTNVPITSVQFAHIWLSVNIPGSTCTTVTTNCVFDPSYKTNVWKTSIASTAATFPSTNEPFTAATTGMGTGTWTGGLAYVNKLNTAGLDAKLSTYAANYLTYIQNNHLQGAQLEDIVGGAVISADAGPAPRSSDLPYQTGPISEHSWACPANPTWPCTVGNAYRTTLRVYAETQNVNTAKIEKMFDTTFFVDEIYGRRLSLGTNFNDVQITSTSQYNTYNVYLKFDDQTLATYTNSGVNPTQHYPVTLQLTPGHPYAAAAPGLGPGSYMNALVQKTVILNRPLSIVHSWGDTGPGLLAKWSGERWMDSSDPSSVATYPGCDTCRSDYNSPTGDFQREKMQASYLAQYTRAAHIHAGLANAVVQLHHVLGAVYSDDYMNGGIEPDPSYPAVLPPDYYVADSYLHIDVDSGFSLTSRTANALDRRAAVQALAGTAATLEASTIAQMADTPDTSSTATRFEWANAPPPCSSPYNYLTCEDPAPSSGTSRNVFSFAPGSTVPATGWALWEDQVTPPPNNPVDTHGDPQSWAGSYLFALTTEIGAYTQLGYTVTASQESFLGPGQRGGFGFFPAAPPPLKPQDIAAYAWTKQRGGAFIATKYDANGDPTNIAHAVVGLLVPNVEGQYYPSKGGGGGVQPKSGTNYAPGDAADVLKSRFVDHSVLFGVNLQNGSMSYTSPASLSVGNGGFPYELDANFSWRGVTQQPSQLFGLLPPDQPTSGWNSNWYNSLSVSGSGMEAMGTSDIRALAGAIASFLAEQDIYHENAPSPQRDVAAVLTQSWWSHQLSGNVVTVSVGASSRQFVALFNGQWISTGPGFASLQIATGARQVYQYICPPPSGSPHWPTPGPDYALSRGWDYSGMVFNVTNEHGDVQQFKYWMQNYADSTQFVCRKMTGFRMETWTFPQGVTVHVNYLAGTSSNEHTEGTSTNAGVSYPNSTQITSVTNGLGAELDFTHTFGILTQVADTHGRTLTISAPTPVLSSMTDPTGATTTFNINQIANTTGSQVAPLPSPTARVITAPQLASVYTANDTVHANVAYTYDGLNQVSQVQDAESVIHPGSRPPYTFLIGDGARGERDDPLGGAYTVVYDTYSHPARYIDEIGRETDAVYDSRDRVVQYTYPEQDEELFGYDDHNNTISYARVAKPAFCTSWPTVCPLLTASAVYDQTWNKPLTVTNANGKTTTLTYYASGNGTSLLHTATRPLDASGHAPVYSFTYDAAGKALTATVPFTTSQNIITTNTYDGSENLLTSALDVSGVDAVTHYGYDAIGNVTSTIDPNNATTISSYDLDRRKLEDDHHDGSATAPLNAVSKTQYDIIGRDLEDDVAKCFDNATTCPSHGASVVTWVAAKTTTYTTTSKVATVTDADGSVITNTYDKDDRLQTVADPVGRKTLTVYDAASQVLKEIRAWSGAGNACSVSGSLQECYATYTYAGDGEKLTEMDANGAIASTHYSTAYAYDGFNRLLTTTFPDASTEQITAYDNDGNILTRVNRAGETLTYTYDNLDRMLTKLMPAVTGVNPAVTTTWTYDLNGAVASLTDMNANSLTYGYDTAGRLTSMSTAIPGLTGTFVTGYVLDDNGNRTQLTWPDGYYVTYAYDSRNRMTVAQEGGTPSTTIATYSYDAMSRRTNLAEPSGTNSAYTYSDAGDLKTLNLDSAAGGMPHYTLGYTAAHQLNSEDTPATTYVWQPTAAATDTYTAANKLNQYPSWTPQGATLQNFTYDLNGNMTAGTIAGAPWTFAYDPENRLITANKTSGGTIAATYAYDPLGRRVHKSGTGVTGTYFLDDGEDEIAEYNSGGTPTWRYIPGPAINEPIATISVSTGARRFFQTDHHGSVIAVAANNSTELEGPYIYDSYGNCFSGTTSCATAGGTSPYRFVGMRLDPETGLYYDRARYYSSVLGRFMQVDPVGYTADLNLYTYVGNDPLDRTDPNGQLDPEGWSLVESATEEAGERAAVVEAAGLGPEDPIADVVALGVIAFTVAEVVADSDKKRSDRLDQAAGRDRGANPARSGTNNRRVGDFTRSQRELAHNENKDRNGGTEHCENCDQVVFRGPASQKGVPTPGNQAQVHHDPAIQNGGGQDSRRVILCATCHMTVHKKKSDPATP